MSDLMIRTVMDYQNAIARQQAMQQGMQGVSGWNGIGGALAQGIMGYASGKAGRQANEYEAQAKAEQQRIDQEQAQIQAEQEQRAMIASQNREDSIREDKQQHDINQIGIKRSHAVDDRGYNENLYNERLNEKRQYAQSIKEPEKPDYKQGDDLRKELIKQTADFPKVNESFSKIEYSYKNPSPANDISMLFGIMKMNDPRSTVREGEIATAKNAGGVDQRMVGFYNSLVNGTQLSPAQREDFYKSARGLYQASAQGYKRTYEQYSQLAQRQGFDPNEIFIQRDVKQFEDEKQATQQPEQMQSQPYTDGTVIHNKNTGEKMVMRGGQWVAQ